MHKLLATEAMSVYFILGSSVPEYNHAAFTMEPAHIWDLIMWLRKVKTFI